RVVRRANVKMLHHKYRIDPELRLTMCEAADNLWRRVAPRVDDGALVDLRPVADPTTDEGHADRTGDRAAVVVRARRPAACGHMPADRDCAARRGGGPGGGRHRHHPGRRT